MGYCREKGCRVDDRSEKWTSGECVKYPGLQGGGALGDALTPGTPAGSIAASAHGGTSSYVTVVPLHQTKHQLCPLSAFDLALLLSPSSH